MQKLLNKTLKTFAIYSLIVLAASVPAYYYLVDGIWIRELDENNEIVANRTEIELNRLNLSDTMLAESIALWNKIQPVTSLKEANEMPARLDSVYTLLRQNPYVTHKDIDRFRVLNRLIHINNKPYYLTVETNVEETEETVAAIAVITLLFFLILVVGFLLLNRKLSARLWRPFRSSLSKLKTFNLNNQTPITFEKSDTLEFEELNLALSKLLEHNISVYKSQKELIENTSHELQTPLAVLRNKLDILLQSEDLTKNQYTTAEEMNNALTRISRISKNLLLLAKIENNQFDSSEMIDFNALLHQSMDALEEHFAQKNISVNVDISPDINLKGNGILAEIMINNLLINAIRHTSPNGSIWVTLTTSAFEVSNSGEKALDTDLLFKRFSRISRDNNGSGLGLAIIKEISRFHNWTVYYRFEKGLHAFSVHI